MAGPNTRNKTNVDAAYFQAAQYYLNSDAFLQAVESAIERGYHQTIKQTNWADRGIGAK